MTPTWEQIEPGAEPAPLVFGPITRTDIVRYQGASGDFNPVHHDEPFATAAGYPAPLTVGMFTAGAMNTWATNWLGPANVRSTRMRWKTPVFPGATLRASGKVLRKFELEGERRVELELSVVDEEDRPCVVGWMTFVVPA